MRFRDHPADLEKFDWAFPENGLTAFYMGTPIGVTVSCNTANFDGSPFQCHDECVCALCSP